MTRLLLRVAQYCWDLWIRYLVPLLIGDCSTTCFPSLPPTQFLKLNVSLNDSAIWRNDSQEWRIGNEIQNYHGILYAIKYVVALLCETFINNKKKKQLLLSVRHKPVCLQKCSCAETFEIVLFHFSMRTLLLTFRAEAQIWQHSAPKKLNLERWLHKMTTYCNKHMIYTISYCHMDIQGWVCIPWTEHKLRKLEGNRILLRHRIKKAGLQFQTSLLETKPLHILRTLCTHPAPLWQVHLPVLCSPLPNPLIRSLTLKDSSKNTDIFSSLQRHLLHFALCYTTFTYIPMRLYIRVLIFFSG